MKKYSLFPMLIASYFLVSACSNDAVVLEEPIEAKESSTFLPDYEWPIASFEAVNQDNEKVTEQDYQGKVWIMNMIFTNCETVCLPMTANMVKLQKQLATENLDVQLVSFSVDPLLDTPEVLKEYALGYEGDFSNWDLLTGYSEEDIKRIAKSVKTLAEKPEGTDQVTHGTKFFLVNQEGIVVTGYDGLSLPIDEIITDLKNIQ
jgi:protein SCO1